MYILYSYTIYVSLGKLAPQEKTRYMVIQYKHKQNINQGKRLYHLHKLSKASEWCALAYTTSKRMFTIVMMIE